MISRVANASKQPVSCSGLHRTRLCQIFERQIHEREGGHFSRLQASTNKLIYAVPVVFMGAACGVAFFPFSILSVSIAAIVFLGFGCKAALTLFSQRHNQSNLELCLSDLRKKYVDIGVIEERDIKELVRFCDNTSLKEMIASMNDEQRLSAYAADPFRVRPMLDRIKGWKERLEIEQKDAEEDPLVMRVLEIDGKIAFKLPHLEEEWDESKTDEMDEYYATHADMYSLNALFEVIRKHPDCEKLRQKLAVNLLSIDFKSPFFDWKKLRDMANLLQVKEVRDKLEAYLVHKLSLELDNPTKEFREVYFSLKEMNKLIKTTFTLNNIRALYDLGIESVQKAVVHFAKSNSESLRQSNVWDIGDMPDAIKQVIYPDQVERYY